MKKLLNTTLLMLVHCSVTAQFAIDVLAGNKNAHYLNYVSRDLDDAAKWNIFSLNRFTVHYEDRALNTGSIESQLTYQIIPWLGLTAGGGFYGELTLPSLGISLSYMNKKEDFFIQLYPTFVYVESQLSPGILGLIGYTPKLSKSCGLSLQILFSADPIEAVQIVRIGANYKEKIQFGVGTDMSQRIEAGPIRFNLGPFVRYTF